VNKKSLLSAFLAAILIGGLILASAMRFGTVQASTGGSSILKPSVPEFTLRYIDLSYDVPPTYGTDPYTGKTIITQDGYHVDNRSLQFTIKNQPFAPYTDSNGTHIGLYYNFRIKGAYGTEWDYYPFAPNGWTTRRYGGMFGGNSTESPADLAQSNSEYTTITIQIPGVYRVPAEAQLEVQAQALIGHMEPTDYMMAGHVYVFTGESSDWSNTQSITISESQTQTPSPSPSPTATSSPAQTSTPTPSEEPQQTLQFEAIVGVAIVALVLGAAFGLLIYFRKRKREAEQL
jgi:hypothetical protein